MTRLTSAEKSIGKLARMIEARRKRLPVRLRDRFLDPADAASLYRDALAFAENHPELPATILGREVVGDRGLQRGALGVYRAPLSPGGLAEKRAAEQIESRFEGLRRPVRHSVVPFAEQEGAPSRLTEGFGLMTRSGDDQLRGGESADNRLAWAWGDDPDWLEISPGIVHVEASPDALAARGLAVEDAKRRGYLAAADRELAGEAGVAGEQWQWAQFLEHLRGVLTTDQAEFWQGYLTAPLETVAKIRGFSLKTVQRREQEVLAVVRDEWVRLHGLPLPVPLSRRPRHAPAR